MKEQVSRFKLHRLTKADDMWLILKEIKIK